MEIPETITSLDWLSRARPYFVSAPLRSNIPIGKTGGLLWSPIQPEREINARSNAEDVDFQNWMNKRTNEWMNVWL